MATARSATGEARDVTAGSATVLTDGRLVPGDPPDGTPASLPATVVITTTDEIVVVASVAPVPASERSAG